MSVRSVLVLLDTSYTNIICIRYVSTLDIMYSTLVKRNTNIVH